MPSASGETCDLGGLNIFVARFRRGSKDKFEELVEEGVAAGSRKRKSRSDEDTTKTSRRSSRRSGDPGALRE